jgi:hypothetical protein
MGESGVHTLVMEADESNDDYLDAIFPTEYYSNQVVKSFYFFRFLYDCATIRD